MSGQVRMTMVPVASSSTGNIPATSHASKNRSSRKKKNNKKKGTKNGRGLQHSLQRLPAPHASMTLTPPPPRPSFLPPVAAKQRDVHPPAPGPVEPIEPWRSWYAYVGKLHATRTPFTSTAFSSQTALLEADIRAQNSGDPASGELPAALLEILQVKKNDKRDTRYLLQQ